MTTTTSTTTATTATTVQAATAAAGSSILTQLGAGSGIDTTTLVTNLTTASFSNKESTLTKKQDANTAQVSALATLTSGIDSFATALSTLVSGGSLKSQPSTSNSGIVTVKAASGADISNLSANVEVRQLAQSQSLASLALPSGSAVGLGSLSLSIGSSSFNISITSANNSMEGLAKAINDANTGTPPSGVTATVVTDSTGKRLVLKGPTGAASNFSLTANSDADADLSRFVFDAQNPTANASMTRAQEAQNAIVRVDGVDSSYATNTVDGLIDGVTLTLVSAQPGTSVGLGVTRPTDAITQAVSDFVDAYNELASEIATATAAATDSADAGPLHGTPGVKEMMRQLRTLTSTTLTTLPGGPQTLAEIGVSTGQDGKLSVDTAKLTKAVATYPASVEAMFNGSQRSSDPLIKVTSFGSNPSGTYTVTGATLGPPMAAQIGGMAALPSSTDPQAMYGSILSTAPGLTVQILGNVSSATITIDAGIVNVLQGIRDDLLKNKSDDDKGALTALSDTLTAQTKSLTSDRTKLTTQETNYSDQLTKQFTAMQTAVSSYKSIQSYMTQQIAQWSKSS